MANITAADGKGTARNAPSAGMMDCKKALTEAEGVYGKGHRMAA